MIRSAPLLVALMLAAAPAHAHASLDHATPRVGSTIPSAPSEVVLTFTQNIEPAFSGVTVRDGAGKRVEAGKPAISGNQMRVPVRGGAPGTYRVRWHVLSVDTHRSDGSFSFRVGQ